MNVNLTQFALLMTAMMLTSPVVLAENNEDSTIPISDTTDLISLQFGDVTNDKIELLIDTVADVSNFDISISNVYTDNFSEGLASESNFWVNSVSGQGRFVGYDSSGESYIPSGSSGVLTTFEYEATSTEVCIEAASFKDLSGNEIEADFDTRDCLSIQDEDDQTAELDNIATVVQESEVHSLMLAAVVQTELLATLQGDSPFTVFAPTDQAFATARIDLSALDTDEGKQVLTDILLYHVYSGYVPSREVTEGMTASMANGDETTFTNSDGLMINDANIVQSDVMASNGIIHIIDKVLTPPEDYNYDSVEDIPTNLKLAGMHNSLLSALSVTGLIDDISQENSPQMGMTILAPTDDAFASAGIDLNDFNTDDEIETLRDILLNHLTWTASWEFNSVSDSDETCTPFQNLRLPMANGEFSEEGNYDSWTSVVFVSNDCQGTITADESNVIYSDILVSNGIIHVIDRVLMPSKTTDEYTDSEENVEYEQPEQPEQPTDSEENVEYEQPEQLDQNIEEVQPANAEETTEPAQPNEPAQLDKETNNTSGFSAGIVSLAIVGAILIAGRRLR